MDANRLMDLMDDYGADMPGVMERFMGDAELYAECLDDFLSDGNFAELGRALAAEDSRSAFAAAHTLKGVAANLGLTKQCGLIGEIVEPLRNGSHNGLIPQYEALMAERARLKELLSAE